MRLPLVIGSLGLPLLFLGMLSLNVRMCIAGAILSGLAALAHAILMLRT